MNAIPSQDDYLKTALRLPRELHAKIIASAQVSGRSLNAEIIFLLTAATQGGPTTADLFRQNVELKSLLTELAETVSLKR